MSASAILPGYLAGAETDPLELSAANAAIRRIQFRSSQKDRGQNLDLVNFSSLFSRNWPDGAPIRLCTDDEVLRRSIELEEQSQQTDLSDARPSIAAVRFARLEATARWINRGLHSRLSVEPVRVNWTAQPPPRNPPNLVEAVRRAYRVVRGAYPAPFSRAHYSIEDGQLTWSAHSSSASVASYHGLSLTNVDLPESFHLCARRDHAHAQYAYRIIELAHDIRGYAFEQYPSLARNPFRGIDVAKHVGGHVQDWLLLVSLSELSGVANEWRELSRREEKAQRQQRGRDEGLREIAKYNAERTDEANNWRSLASQIAKRLRDEDSARSLKSIAEEVAETISRDFETSMPSAETVNRFLRDQYPNLRRQPASEKTDYSTGDRQR